MEQVAKSPAAVQTTAVGADVYKRQVVDFHQFLNQNIKKIIVQMYYK